MIRVQLRGAKIGQNDTEARLPDGQNCIHAILSNLKRVLGPKSEEVILPEIGDGIVAAALAEHKDIYSASASQDIISTSAFEIIPAGIADNSVVMRAPNHPFEARYVVTVVPG